LEKKQKKKVLAKKESKALRNSMDSERLTRAIVALVELVARLRSPNGCPWDIQQTDSSIKLYLLEEAYEVLDAVEKSSPQDVCSELGDLLFQILFLAQLAAERKEFDFVEVVEKISEKMIKRHPHVFGGTKVDSAEDVALNWARIKAREKSASRKTSSFFESVPSNLPALLRAHRLSERASKLNSGWTNAEEIWDKILEQFEALKSAVTQQERDLVSKEMGGLLFNLVNLTRHWGLNAENLLRLFNREFLECLDKADQELNACGIKLEEATSDQMKRALEKIKKIAL
jgi:MazG family protein